MSSSEEKKQSGNITYEQDGVFIHLFLASASPEVVLGGTLKIVEKDEQMYLQWTSNEDQSENKSTSSENQSSDDTVDNKPTNSGLEISSEMRQPLRVVKQQSIDADWSLVSQNNKVEDLDQSEEKYVAVEKDELNPCYDFTISLDHLRFLKKSKKKLSWKYIIFELYDGAFLPPLHFHQRGSKKFLKALKVYLSLKPCEDDPDLIEITTRNQAALSQSLSELNIYSETTSENTANFFASAMSGFSKVTSFIHDVLNPQEIVPQTRPPNERASLMDESAIVSPADTGRNSEYEHISCPKLSERVEVPRQSPMSESFWLDHKEEDGRIKDVEEVKKAIFHGGMAPDLRKEVWKYLLGYYDWNMTEKDLATLKEKRHDDYYRVKMQWKSVDEDQESRFSLLKEQKNLIEKDVNRTDRKRLFYEGEENISVSVLHDILVTYVMYNFDLGYVQGMSDLLSPILETMQSEVDAFWCFVGFMKQVEHNFDKNQRGMKQHLHDLRTLLECFDPELLDDLKEKDSSNLYFCFRWLLLLFKREFSFEDIQTLWEVIWTGLPCKNYHLLLCTALLNTERQTLLQKECGLNDILKHINDLSNSINLNEALEKTEGMFNQLIACKNDLPPSVCDVLKLTKA